MVHERNRRNLVQSRFFGSFDVTWANIPQLGNFKTARVVKEIWKTISTIASIRRENMLGYLPLDIICSSKLKLFSNCSLLGTDNVHGKISKHIFAPNGSYCWCTSHFWRRFRLFDVTSICHFGNCFWHKTEYCFQEIAKKTQDPAKIKKKQLWIFRILKFS